MHILLQIETKRMNMSGLDELETSPLQLLAWVGIKWYLDGGKIYFLGSFLRSRLSLFLKDGES